MEIRTAGEAGSGAQRYGSARHHLRRMVTDSVGDRFLAQAKVREIVPVLALLVPWPFGRAVSHRLFDLRGPIETVGLVDLAHGRDRVADQVTHGYLRRCVEPAVYRYLDCGIFRP